MRESFRFLVCAFVILITFHQPVAADSVNSPNITMNVDTNRSTGNGAGNVSVTINTITLAETSLPEYSSGSGKKITLKARPGYQFDTTSNITIQSATIGFNGLGLNAVASVAPTGASEETITFNLTSGTNTTVQDIVRINGIKVKILNALGAAGPAQTTMSITTSTAGGAFTDQGIVATNINKGAPDHLAFAIQPGDTQSGFDILPTVAVQDFGNNIINTGDSRTISLALQANPGSATLLGTAQRLTASGLATWVADDDLRINTAASGYTLRASHSGANFLTSDTVDSNAFAITAGNPGGLQISAQPADTSAGGDILVTVQVVDNIGNPTTTNGVNITLDSAVNPGGWPLLTDTSLTKASVNGVAQWTAADHLRITKATANYKLSASGLGAPVQTNVFNIIVGTASIVRFAQAPSELHEDETFHPAVTAEVIDLFGNRTASTATVTLGFAAGSCDAALSGNSAAAVDGLATFNSLVADGPCDDAVLQASISGGIADAASDKFDIESIDSVPVAVKLAKLKPGKQFKFTAKGSFTISKETDDDPTKKGGSLVVTGTNGSVTYKLPKGKWEKSGSGFKFSNKKCESVVVKGNTISALCKGKTGTVTLPEEDALAIVLNLGQGTAQFCGHCGGTAQGDEDTIFHRTNCEADDFCP